MGKQSFVGRDEILGWARRGGRRGIQNLKTRAASGDPRAVARLQRLRAALAAPDAPASAPAPYAAQPGYASNYPAYQSPYFDASLSQDPYGPAPQPTIDVFQGDAELAEIVSSGDADLEEIVGADDVELEKLMKKAIRPSLLTTVLATGRSDAELAKIKAKADAGDKKSKNLYEGILAAKKKYAESYKYDSSGLDEILGSDEIVGSLLSKTVGAVKKVAGLPLDVAAWALRRTPSVARSMFVGHDEILGGAFIGDDERAYAEDGGMADKMALQRRITSSGYNGHLAYVRGEDMDQQGRQSAKKILQQSVDAKSIKKSDLKRAIELYAGASATTREKTAVGSKMLDFLTKKQIKIEG